MITYSVWTTMVMFIEGIISIIKWFLGKFSQQIDLKSQKDNILSKMIFVSILSILF